MRVSFLTFAAILAVFTAHETAAQRPRIQNSRAGALIQGCSTLKAGQPDGFYWTSFDNNQQFLMYCDNHTDFAGRKGGWTLVWSNLRQGTGKLTTDMEWGPSIYTLPRYKGAPASQLAANLWSFEVYTGLDYWRKITEGGRHELMYQWQANLGDHFQPDHVAACPYDMQSGFQWQIRFTTAECAAIIGSTNPAMFSTTSGQKWTTIDQDNDSHPDVKVNCAVASSSGNPWWYYACQNGSLWGGGERSHGSYNGAYWTGDDSKPGNIDGTGAGNGWIFIR